MCRLSVRSLLILPLVVGIYACAQEQAGNPSSPSVAPLTQDGAQAKKGSSPGVAVVRFGRPDTGSPFPPVPEHDRSAHAKDNLNPQNVVIDVGESVRFEAPPNVHQIAIYDDGKDVRDVNVGAPPAFAPAPCPPVPLINDPVMRIAFQVYPCFQPWTYTHTFENPGKYLVICTFTPHFEVGMYGWVRVRDRKH